MDKIEIYTTPDGKIQIGVALNSDTIWLDRKQMSVLFERDIKTIGKHINNIFLEGELDKDSVVANFATTASDGKTYQIEHYNLDVVISVGYRVKSLRGTQFRQWATQRIKNLLIEGFSYNEKRLAQQNKEIKVLHDGIRILHRSIIEMAKDNDFEWLHRFSLGLELLDDYDHKSLDKQGNNTKEAKYPPIEEFVALIGQMQKEVSSRMFGLEKDDGFRSAVNQIRQSLAGRDLYSSIEEKLQCFFTWLLRIMHLLMETNESLPLVLFYFSKETEYYTNQMAKH